MTDLLDLAVRVEGAEGADRAIDKAINQIICHPGPFTCPVPAYTASLDAAMGLVPEGCGIEMRRYWLAEPEHGVWSASLRWGISGAQAHAEDCNNAALALAAAALRARASQDASQ
jgi:hypothetical protein